MELFNNAITAIGEPICPLCDLAVTHQEAMNKGSGAVTLPGYNSLTIVHRSCVALHNQRVMAARWN